MRCTTQTILLGILLSLVAAGPLPAPDAQPTDPQQADTVPIVKDLLAGKTDSLKTLADQGADALPKLRRLRDTLATVKTEDAKAAEQARRHVDGCIAAIKNALQPEIRKLVAELGADNFKQRRRARQKLAAIGAPALKQLRRAADSPDPEVRLVARDLVLTLEIGRWRQRLITHLEQTEGITIAPEDIETIRPKLTQQLCPDHRYFDIPKQGDESHYWVSRSGKVGLIGLSTGGDLTPMFGGARPVVKTKADAAAFYELVGHIRYGFSDDDVRQSTVEQADDTTWTAQISHRFFTATFDRNGRFEKLHMR